MASSAPSKWPGEWHPARNDVALASEAPDPDLLVHFKSRLLASEDARDTQPLMHLDLTKERGGGDYTYPVALLSQLPTIPDHYELLRLWQEFANRKSELPFLDDLSISSGSRDAVAPHLLLAAGSYALVAESDGRAKDLFIASVSLWSAMLEIDHRETRTEDTLISGVLLSLYGPMESDSTVWRWARLILYGVVTIARRRRLHNYCLLEGGSSLESYRWAIAALWLGDLLQAIHLDAPMNFSTEELSIGMPQSSYTLPELRSALLDGRTLPEDVKSRGDALLLVMAILTDAIYLQRALGRWSCEPDRVNPFVPFSPYSEFQRMHAKVSSALDGWSRAFVSADSDVNVLYYYSQMYVTFPEVIGLANRIGYLDTATTATSDVKVPDAAARYAWQILDTAAATSSSASSALTCLWFPAAVFHAGLVIWADITNCTSMNAPSKRVLVPFILELQKMGWPCSSKMANALQNLMDS